MQRRIFQSLNLVYVVRCYCTRVGGIYLWDLHTRSRSFQFWKTITKRPHLGALVRRISFKGFPRQSTRDVMIKPSVVSFVDILDRLTRLEHFIFEAPDCGPIAFHHLAMPIQSAICKVMQESKALTRLDLLGLCSVPATLVVQPANLVDLSLVSVTSNNTRASGAYGTSVSPQRLRFCSSFPWSIRTDQLKGVVQLLKDSSLSLANLHTLEIEAQQTNKLDIEYLLSRVAKEKLRTLTLRRPLTDARELTFSEHRHTIDLHAFRSLTQLNLSMGQLYMAHGRGDSKTPIPWVISILKTLPDFPIDGARKSRLRLELNGNLFSHLSGNVNDIPWELVAKVLLSRQNRFEEVEIRMTIIPKAASIFVTPTQKTIDALKSHPGIRMMEGFVKFRYLVEENPPDFTDPKF